MWEAARDRTGTMPRVFGVNHHPEIVNRARALRILWDKRSRGEVSHEWYASAPTPWPRRCATTPPIAGSTSRRVTRCSGRCGITCSTARRHRALRRTWRSQSAATGRASS